MHLLHVPSSGSWSTGWVERRDSGSATALCMTKPRLSPQHLRGKLLTPSYSHGPLAPCFPAQQSPSHQKLRVLALGRWLLAGLSRELRHPSNVPLVGAGVPGEVECFLYSSSTGGGAVQVPGQPLLLFTPPSLHSLLPISKVAFSVEKPQNLTLFEIFFFAFK